MFFLKKMNFMMQISTQSKEEKERTGEETSIVL